MCTSSMQSHQRRSDAIRTARTARVPRGARPGSSAVPPTGGRVRHRTSRFRQAEERSRRRTRTARSSTSPTSRHARLLVAVAQHAVDRETRDHASVCEPPTTVRAGGEDGGAALAASARGPSAGKRRASGTVLGDFAST